MPKGLAMADACNICHRAGLDPAWVCRDCGDDFCQHGMDTCTVDGQGYCKKCQRARDKRMRQREEAAAPRFAPWPPPGYVPNETGRVPSATTDPTPPRGMDFVRWLPGEIQGVPVFRMRKEKTRG